MNAMGAIVRALNERGVSAYELGAIARCAHDYATQGGSGKAKGPTRDSCPYPAGSFKADAWLKGWDEEGKKLAAERGS